MLILVGVIVGKGSDRTFAQVVADPSLGTKVTPNGTTLDITGGTTVGDTNLFHSFSDFIVRTDEIVDFLNSSTINNIFVRVTGRNPSDIQGILKAQGKANLFLLSPKGIVFGQNARLDIGGSFIGTTANVIQFPNGGEFSMTSPVNPANPLLKVNPSALLFNQIAASPISIQAFNPLSPGREHSLVLVGGDVNLQRTVLSTAGGRIELGGLNGKGTVGLNIDGNNFRLSFPEEVQRADISIDDASRVTADGGGGSIQLQGRRVSVTGGSTITAITLDLDFLTVVVTPSGFVDINRVTMVDPRSGTLVVNASESVELVDQSGLQTTTDNIGDAGDLSIETGRLILKDGSQITVSTSPLSQGRGGRLSITARDSIYVSGIASKRNPSGLYAVTEGAGDAGELKIETGQLIVEDAGQVAASTRGQGRGGNLSITARDSIKVIGTKDGIPSGLFVGTRSAGDAGELKIETGQLIVQNEAQVSASTFPNSTGQGGSIIIKAGELNVLNNADITVSSQGANKAGDLEINARSIKLDNQSNLIGQAKSGNGGNITLNLQDLLLLSANSQISTNAGTAQQGGDGGNITINAPNGFIVAKPNENSDITANAYDGKGGTVTINAIKIFGIAPLTRQDLERLRPKDLNPRRLATNDITAISQTSPNLSGIVQINTLDADPYQGLINLPAVPVDTQVSQACQAPTAQNQSSFTVTGRGGLPPNPRTEPLSSDAVQVDWVTLKPMGENPVNTNVSTQATSPTPAPIVEAQGWVKNAQGEIVLTAYAPTTTPSNSWQKPVQCSTAQSTTK
ncbi:filamentous hemagglutinin N-terminal domain-containing protein [Nostoc sp. CHAB 5836]|uniref:two-partner secretion domain-containing protein n=1 Tax=Nostoc sp. CHAB 5836 TaxID=2780404 RepID=UPI001E435645|nr:filamentous hemagglutinin N-terminal domain-containing protein [Nostoc sp. CHAB 5836]MCC5617391.1 filamentous hemagglutinin N-terminal domain-containing protein [Nostoc sp. CHAB 5836]